MLEIGVLGPVAVRRGGRPVHVGGARQRALLVRLVLARGRSVPGGVLISDLWPGPASGDALKTAVGRLRKVVGADAIGFDGTGYVLHAAPEAVDAYRFEAGVALARAQRTGDAELAATTYAHALDLWTGQPFGDVESAAWAQPEAARLEELRLVAVEERFEALVRSGGAGELVGDLTATVREYPWREQLTAHLMVALYRCGRQREALEAFDHLANSLREELGLEPSPAVRELERAILAQDPVLDPPSRFAGVPSRHGREATARARSFVGRGAELAQLEAAVKRHRVIAIVGAGGTGKTRLADELAQRIGERYRDGACFVELGAVRAGELVADHIASRLGLVDSAEIGPPEPADLLIGFLREREMLLVLDGCEAVLDVTRTLIARLVAECARLQIVTTSRAHLDADEVTFALGPMPPPPADATAPELAANEAVRLFLARRAPGANDATQRDLTAIGELTRLVAGNPLAIELVAGLTGRAAPTSMLNTAREWLGATGAAPAPVANRAATLQTTLTLTHDGLGPDAQVLFRRAGVFAAGFRLNALEAVAGGSGLDPAAVAAALDTLETTGLVYPVEHSADRRRMLDTVREDALTRLKASGDWDTTLARQTAYYLDLAQRCDRALRGHGQDDARATFDCELDNLRDVLGRLLAAGAGDTAARLAAALCDYWYLRGHWAEKRRWVERCIAATPSSVTLSRARLLRADATQAGFVGLRDRVSRLEEALTIAREIGSPEDEIWTLLFMAGAESSGGISDRAPALLATADFLVDQLDDPWVRAVRRSYIAASDVSSDPQHARAEQLRAHTELLALGDRAWAGRCLWFAGSIARRSKDFVTATRELERAIELCEASGDRAATAHARASLARTALARGDASAGAIIERGLEEFAAIGDARCADKLRSAVASASSAEVAQVHVAQ